MITLFQNTSDLTTAGLVFMLVVWSLTIGFTIYCFIRILKIGNKLPADTPGQDE